ncbi:hypothetical protein ACFSUD_05455 [Sulfitobacter aestuarii]|uniref:Uncharacterized protein n=1 Tax=Sulfitobacter aestuarii TaxID=2161676 RepID=A0ABW5U0A9_9RHOB
MPKANRNFELTIQDIDLIEAALHVTKREMSTERMAGTTAMLPEAAVDDPLRQIDDLLGRLHNQKVFYRPGKSAYVSG